MTDLADFAAKMYQPKRTQEVLDYQRALEELIDTVTDYGPALEQLVCLIEIACARETYDDRRELFIGIADVLKAINTGEGHSEVTYKLWTLMRDMYRTFEGAADD